jgi:hypothetical protein
MPHLVPIVRIGHELAGEQAGKHEAESSTSRRPPDRATAAGTSEDCPTPKRQAPP